MRRPISRPHCAGGPGEGERGGEVRTAQVRHAEVPVDKARVAKIRVAEARAAKVRFAEVRFTGGEAELAAYLDLGLHVGITGWICDERRVQTLQALVHRIPTDKLLLETDAPYLLPRDLKQRVAARRNEPRFLPHIAAEVARLRGESLETCSANSTAAARALFGLPVPV